MSQDTNTLGLTNENEVAQLTDSIRDYYPALAVLKVLSNDPNSGVSTDAERFINQNIKFDSKLTQLWDKSSRTPALKALHDAFERGNLDAYTTVSMGTADPSRLKEKMEIINEFKKRFENKIDELLQDREGQECELKQ